jgi:hypothetical protein
MKAQLRVRPNLTLELEAEQQQDLFRLVASAQEVFGEQKCGKCKSGNLAFRVRHVKNNDFYEIVCNGCHAVLQLGAHKQGGTLFPRRHVETEGGVKEWLADNGWLKWDPEAERMV